MSNRVESDRVAMYYKGQSGRGKAALMISRATANFLVETLEADWEKKKARFIILKRTQASLHRAAPSLTMGPRIIFEAACGSSEATALADGWYSNHCAA